MSDPNKLGRFVWHELLTNDVAAELSFYTKVVGWKTQDWEGDTPYRMFVGEKGPTAGIMQLPEGANPGWLTYIATPDVDRSANQAEELGGSILRAPADIPGVGRFAVIRDPQGAVFCLFTSPADSPPMGDGPPAIGEFSWHELATGDPDAAWSFYSEMFGWKKTEAMGMGEMGVYQMFGDGQSVGAIYRKAPQTPGPPAWTPYAYVRDTRVATETASELGATIMNGNMEVPGGDLITLAMDPEGIVFAVHSRGTAAAAAVPASDGGGSTPAARPKKAARKKAAPKKKAAKRSAPRKKAAPKKATKKKAAKKKAAKKASRKAVRRKVARKPMRRTAARKPARRKAARKKAARRPMRRAKRKSAARGTSRRRPMRKKAARGRTGGRKKK